MAELGSINPGALFKWFDYHYKINDINVKEQTKNEQVRKRNETDGGAVRKWNKEVIALATISLSPSAAGNLHPVFRMVCTYYEGGVFYVSTYAKKN